MTYTGDFISKLIKEKYQEVYQVEEDDWVLVDFVPVEGNELFGIGMYFWWEVSIYTAVSWFRIPYEEEDRISNSVGNWAYEIFSKVKDKKVMDNTVSINIVDGLPVDMNNIDDILNSVKSNEE